MTINSKQKGNAGERELSNEFKKYGFATRRSVQYCGGTEESMDIVGLPGIHVECKRTERLKLYDAIEQATNDNLDRHLLPVVFHRKNRKQWLAIMDLDTWMIMYLIYIKYYSQYMEETSANT